MEPSIITINGGSGSGKTTVARTTAALLRGPGGAGVQLLLTGRIYRTIAQAISAAGITLADDSVCVEWWRAKRVRLSDAGEVICGEECCPWKPSYDFEAFGTHAAIIAAHSGLRSLIVSSIRGWVVTQLKAGARFVVLDCRDGPEICGAIGVPSVHFFVVLDQHFAVDRRASQTGESRELVAALMSERAARDTGLGRLTPENVAPLQNVVKLDGRRSPDRLAREIVARLSCPS